MQINRDLKLVLPCRRSESGDIILRAYHSPIAHEVFESNYRVLSATKSELFKRGLAYAADTAPQIATLRLRDEGRRDAAEMGMFDPEGKPQDGGVGALLAEIKRLTLILSPSPAGWTNLPVDAAIRDGHIDAEEWREVESQIVFFMAAYAMAPRAGKAAVAKALAGVMRGEITSSNPMDFCASLTTSTPIEASAPKVASSVPT